MNIDSVLVFPYQLLEFNPILLLQSLHHLGIHIRPIPQITIIYHLLLIAMFLFIWTLNSHQILYIFKIHYFYILYSLRYLFKQLLPFVGSINTKYIPTDHGVNISIIGSGFCNDSSLFGYRYSIISQYYVTFSIIGNLKSLTITYAPHYIS
ncbi:hypothetical protein pb186bvf_019093 [Paramecium bursaria]